MSSPAVYAAIASVMADLSQVGVPKTGRNETEGYEFRSIDQIYNRLSPSMAKHKLCILPRMLERTAVERRDEEGAAVTLVTVRVAFDFVSAQDGSSHSIETFGEALDPGDKATAKAMTSAFKAAVQQVFCMPAAGVEDPEFRSWRVRNAAHVAEPDQGWEQWNRDVADMVAGCVSTDAVDLVQSRYRGLLKSLSRERPNLYASLGKTIQARRQELAGAVLSAPKKQLNGKANGRSRKPAMPKVSANA